MIDGIAALRSISPTGSSLAVSGATTGGLMTQATSDFGQVLGQIATDAVGTLRQGESAAIQGIQGKASLQSVVQSVMAAEQTLQTAIAVRDKVVAAYQEISRMAI